MDQVFLIIFGAILISSTHGYTYLSTSDRDYEQKLEYQKQNIARIENVLYEIRNDPQKYPFRAAMHFLSRVNSIDTTRPDALDDVQLITKNSLYRYRVNRRVLERVQSKIKCLIGKTLQGYEVAGQFVIKLNRKLTRSIGNRSYIVTSSEIRRPITFS